MYIVTKATHYMRQTHIVRDCVKGALHSLGGLSAASLLLKADDAVVGTGDCIYKIRGEVFFRRNFFDDSQCREEDRHILRKSLLLSRMIKNYKFQIALSVEPSMNVDALNLLLKAASWIPEKNFLLVKDEECSLDDDNPTLCECGIEKEDSELLACMCGSCPIYLYHYDPPEPNKEFVIQISSCFETVGELKKKILKKMGKTPNDQEVFYQNEHLTNSDSTTLVGRGIVRQYLRYLPKMSKGVEIVNFSDDVSPDENGPYWRGYVEMVSFSDDVS